ncbi:MAG: transcription antitermination factor NusB [Cyanobacteria bacterium P01_H01_bin.74]
MSNFEKPPAQRLKLSKLLNKYYETHQIESAARSQTKAFCSGVLREWFALSCWIDDLTTHTSKSARHKPDKPKKNPRNEEPQATHTEAAFNTFSIYKTQKQFETPPKLKHLLPRVRTILRMGLYQLAHPDQWPAHAAIFETVELAKKNHFKPSSIRQINGILREAQRQLACWQNTANITKQNNTGTDFLSSQYACWPTFWETLLFPETDHTPSTLNKQLAEFSMANRVKANPFPELSIRVNTLQIAIEAYKNELTQADVFFSQPDPERLPEWLLINEQNQPFPGPTQLPGFESGWYYIQNKSSIRVSRFIKDVIAEQWPLKNNKNQIQCLDLCAAPGSKSTHLAALFDAWLPGQFVVTATDSSEFRLQLLQDNQERLRIPASLLNILPYQDATDRSKQYDIVLVDAPCSASGTTARHPEVLVQLCQGGETKLDTLLTGFHQNQVEILNKAKTLLHADGLLIYSTCSMFEKENQETINQFLETHQDFASLIKTEDHKINDHSDGFFMAAMQVFKSKILS